MTDTLLAPHPLAELFPLIEGDNFEPSSATSRDTACVSRSCSIRARSSTAATARNAPIAAIRSTRSRAPNTAQNRGFQSLLVRLQSSLNRTTGELTLSDEDLDRIPRYAFKYQNGGWQNRLTSIFGRTLGPALGRR
jgi:hypothetical protein